ncbi:insulinase family protein [Neochlamydia sp. S13]|uniref:insulinase family protein n=1 Tax=Neochlamydia sp. S13 TaxID=1353976 RepID=UPI0005A7D82D|nr:insulinase family protein [Neochlamydia sp. S13]BBI16570.1 hypothetical protein NCS13_1_0375 [Neochlamydia sp. S13]
MLGKIYLSFLYILPFFSLEGLENAKSLSFDPENLVREVVFDEKKASTLPISEWRLKNGMKVILKQTNDEENEISVRLVALGGYGSVEPEDRASAELAASVAMESGIGEWCPDKLAVLLYDQSIELNIKIEPFVRSIDASFPPESLEIFFTLVKKIFQQPRCTPEAFNHVLKSKKDELTRRGREVDSDRLLKVIAVHEQHALNPLSFTDLKKARVSQSERFFRAAFSNPADFVCIIVGKVNPEKIKKLCSDSFSALDVQKIDQKFILPHYKKAPKVRVTKIHHLPHNQESLVYLSLPLHLCLDPTRLEHLELACQMIETRLRNHIKNHSSESRGMDVRYELPLYPSLEYPWITVQFHVDDKQINSTLNLALQQIKSICREGFSLDEVTAASQIKQKRAKLWRCSHDYWIILLSNHYLWKWDSKKIVEGFQMPQAIDPKEIHFTLCHSLLIDEYTPLHLED